ncbi:MAG: hypothetical protein IKQ39_00320 [Oscillospiraceae bacterium]|nr:hypothetical protein [Oscillospiraceae bacterium]
MSPTSSGVDFEAASALGVQVIWALSLPGKMSPVSAGEIVARTVRELRTEQKEGGAPDD